MAEGGEKSNSAAIVILVIVIVLGIVLAVIRTRRGATARLTPEQQAWVEMSDEERTRFQMEEAGVPPEAIEEELRMLREREVELP